MSERLEEIKEAYRWAIENSIANRIADSDIEWLIQQSGKVEELELEINAWRNAWREEVQKRQRFYKESEESHLETKELIKSIVNQNKRYREALEEIRCLYPLRNVGYQVSEIRKIVIKALEGEGNA